MVKMKNMVRASLFAAVAATAIAGGAAAQQVDRLLQTGERSTQEGVTTQERINRIDDQRTDIELEYRTLLTSIESQRLFIQQQEIFIRSQEAEIASLQSQLDRVEDIEVDLAPMMREMVVNLENFVTLDLPFRLDGAEGRLARVEALYELLDDPDITPAERYRVILNRYEIEAQSGRAVRAFEDQVLVDDVPVTVDVLQVGRTAMVRRYPESQGSRLEIFHVGGDDWQELPGSYLNEVNRAIRVAQGATTVQIFLTPLPGPTTAQ